MRTINSWLSFVRDPRPVAGRRLRTTGRRPETRGFTLAEGLIASVVLALVVSAVAAGMIATGQASSASQQDLVAVGLARELMGEVVSRPFVSPLGDRVTTGHDNADARANFTYISDYDGYSDTTEKLKTQSGQAISTDGGTYRRSVSVQYKQLSPDAPPSWDCAQVCVKVIEPSGQTVALNRIVTRVIR